MLTTFTLKNGLKVAAYSIPSMRSVYVELSAKGGSVFETKDTNGVAHFMEHMLVQGIPSLPDVEVFSDYIEGLAGRYNAMTYGEHIKFVASVPAASLPDILRIASEIFFEPLFPEDALERERNAILEEIQEKQDASWYKNSRFFVKARFKNNHPLRLDSGGSLSAIANLTRQQLIDYWARFFYPSNTYLTIVGGFGPGNIQKIVEDYFQRHQITKQFPGFPKVTNAEFSSRKVAIRNDADFKSCYLDLTFPSICHNTLLKDRITQMLIKSILTGLERSRLYRLLRQRKGLVYSIGFGSVAYHYFGYAYISSQVSLDKLDEVMGLIIKEVVDFINLGPLKQEVNFAKSHYMNRMLMQWDHPSAISDWIAGDLMWEDKIYTPEEYAKIIEKIGVLDIKEFMKKYWDFAKLNLTIQGPIKNSRENIKKYTKMLEILQ